MKRTIIATLLLMAACTVAGEAQIAVPAPSEIHIIGGSPNVLDWPVTSHLTDLRLGNGRIHIDHTKRGTWLPVVIAPDGTTQEATIWVFFRINGTWYGTGGERLRPNQTEKDLGSPNDIGPGWFYAADRWGVMSGYVPQPGEPVGFLVAAGSTRADDSAPQKERTELVVIPWSWTGGTWPPFAAVESQPGPVVTPPVNPPPPAFDVHDLLVRLEEQRRRMDTLESDHDTDVAALRGELGQVAAKLSTKADKTESSAPWWVRILTLGMKQ